MTRHLLASGLPDPNFGVGGYVKFSGSSSLNGYFDNRSRLLTFTTSTSEFSKRILISRTLAEGLVDTNFGDRGTLILYDGGRAESGGNMVYGASNFFKLLNDSDQSVYVLFMYLKGGMPTVQIIHILDDGSVDPNFKSFPIELLPGAITPQIVLIH